MAWMFSLGMGAFPKRLSWRWVRLRSGSPSGAMRSSIWKTWTRDQGTSSEARSLSMAQGVFPPLTARVKMPRAATASRAAAAMTPAAALATASSLARTSIFMRMFLGNYFRARKRRMRALVELSCLSSGSVGASNSGMMCWASCLPSSTPHWSKELMPQTAPWVKTLCS